MTFGPFRHLLRHPAVTSFLWLKWQRIRRYVLYSEVCKTPQNY
jgi:hypothetical protein